MQWGMSDITSIGGISHHVEASAEVFLDAQGNPVPVSKESALPVVVRGFQIPDHNDIEIQRVPGDPTP
jgi:hypothetical protein